MTKPTSFLDDTLVSRWALEPRYPPVNAQDLLKMEALSQQLRSRGPIVHDLHGVKVGVDAALHPYISYLVVNNAYEEGDLRLIRAHVRSQDRAMVLGAGMGVIAAGLALATGCEVPCVDANPEVEAYVALTATLNGVQLPFIHGAIVPGREDGVVDFALSEEFWASSLRPDTYKLAARIQAPVLSLPAVMAQREVNTLFVDIEGAEVGLFTQRAVPASVKKLFVEVHRPVLTPSRWGSVLNDLYDLGFRLRDCIGLTHYWQR